jgi:hypothetical protein
MIGACNVCGEDKKNAHKVLVGKLKESDDLEDLKIDGR